VSGLAFVDTNVFVYAVGREHPLREPASAALRERLADGVPMATSAEVLQELLHLYLPVGRSETLDAALRLARDLTTVWSVESSDVIAARELAATEPGLGARDLLHLVMCRRYAVDELLTFDRTLRAAFDHAG
jgi:predicted nucleic acid-binding protein